MRTLVFVIGLTVALLLVVSQAGGVWAQASEKAQPVYVVSQPATVNVQGEVRVTGPIAGEVSIREPIPQGKAVILGEVEVPPVQKTDVTGLVRAGTLTSEDFATMVGSLAGMQRSSPTKAGKVGGVLLPAEGVPTSALKEHSELLFAVERHGLSSPGVPPYFASHFFVRHRCFSCFRVLHNASDRTVPVTVFVYLTS